MFEPQNQETFIVMACDNGYIVNISIPFDRSEEQFEMLDKLTDKIIRANNKITGDEYKNDLLPIGIGVPRKNTYTFVCRDKKEVSQKLEEFYKIKSK